MLKLKDLSEPLQEIIIELSNTLYGTIELLDDYTEHEVFEFMDELDSKGIDAGLYIDNFTLLCGILKEFEETQNINFDFD